MPILTCAVATNSIFVTALTGRASSVGDTQFTFTERVQSVSLLIAIATTAYNRTSIGLNWETDDRYSS